MNIYETCPVLESWKFLLRLVENKDSDDLLKVYSDKNALPFFNSDNCDGDNFYYATKERMAEALDFWNLSYEKEDILFDIISLITPRLSELLGCKGILTKAPIYAVERIKAIQKAGFTKSEHLLIGKTGYAYDGYWTIN